MVRLLRRAASLPRMDADLRRPVYLVAPGPLNGALRDALPADTRLTSLDELRPLGEREAGLVVVERDAVSPDDALALAEEIAALDAGEFEVYFQPVVELGGQSIVGAEALVRWRQDDGRIVGPDDFLPVAEESGLIVALGRWVLDTA
ncbi:MAG: EAL domain-containing protein, partial [Gemmatimonadetes bacterium]|nr:EAL domain-containing protein [Gemmatimonadota bacterium]